MDTVHNLLGVNVSPGEVDWNSAWSEVPFSGPVTNSPTTGMYVVTLRQLSRKIRKPSLAKVGIKPFVRLVPDQTSSEWSSLKALNWFLIEHILWS